MPGEVRYRAWMWSRLYSGINDATEHPGPAAGHPHLHQNVVLWIAGHPHMDPFNWLVQRQTICTTEEILIVFC